MSTQHDWMKEGLRETRSFPADFAKQRADMVRHQLEARGIRDPSVLWAFSAVARERFVPSHLVEAAYDDTPLPIGYGQTISQPYCVALMAEALRLHPGAHVLDVGTGSGYAAAILSCIARHVWSVEVIPTLAQSAATLLRELGFDNVTVGLGDGSRGWPEHAPFDAIMVAAGSVGVPEALCAQLADGGRFAIPISNNGGQRLLCVTRRANDLDYDDLGPVAFVPLVGGGASVQEI